MTQARSVSGNQNREIRKREWHQATFNLAEWDSAQIGKKGKQGIDKWWDREGHTLTHPEEGNQPGTFKGIKAERRKEWEKQEIEPAEWKARNRLCSQEGKTGEPMVPLEGQNFIIKGRGRLRRKGSEKEREKKDFLEKRTISKVVVKRKKTLREKWILLPDIL